jgi:hypothetical protein
MQSYTKKSRPPKISKVPKITSIPNPRSHLERERERGENGGGYPGPWEEVRTGRPAGKGVPVAGETTDSGGGGGSKGGDQRVTSRVERHGGEMRLTLTPTDRQGKIVGTIARAGFSWG